MDSQYKLLSELLSDQAAFITSPKTSLANYWGALPPCPPVSTGLTSMKKKIREAVRKFTHWDVDVVKCFCTAIAISLSSNSHVVLDVLSGC